MATQLNKRPGYMIDYDRFNQQTFSASGQALLKKDPLTKVDKAAFCFTVMETFDLRKATPDQFQDFLLAVKFMIDTQFGDRAGQVFGDCLPGKDAALMYHESVDSSKPGNFTGRTQSIPVALSTVNDVKQEILLDLQFVSTVVLCGGLKEDLSNKPREQKDSNREQDLIYITDKYAENLRNNGTYESDPLILFIHFVGQLASLEASIAINKDQRKRLSEELVGNDYEAQVKDLNSMFDGFVKSFGEEKEKIRTEMVKIFSNQAEIKNSVKPTVFIRVPDWVLERIEGVKFLEGMAKWLLSWKMQAMESSIRQFLVAGTGGVAISAQPGGSERSKTDEQKILKDDPSLYQDQTVTPSYGSQKNTLEKRINELTEALKSRQENPPLDTKKFEP